MSEIEVQHPFAALGPERVLDAVEALGIDCDGRLLALNSFENRVYLVGRVDAAPLIAKFYRPGRYDDATILDEHHFLDELAAADLPVAAPLRDAAGRSLLEVGSDPSFRVALFPKLRGRDADLESREHLEWLGRTIARLHQVGQRQHFQARAPLAPGLRARQALLDTLAGPLLPSALQSRYSATCEALIAAIEQRFAACAGVRQLRLHGDLHRGNLLWNESGPALVDFDDCVEGPAVQDLWMLLPGDAEGRELALQALLDGYTSLRDFDHREIALIEPLQALRLISYGGWLSARDGDPAFPRAFPHARSPRFWDEHWWALEELRQGALNPSL